jgi:site-specific recombinase XerD
MVNVSLFNDNVKTLKRNDCNLLGVDNDIDAIKLWLNNYDKHTNKLYRSVIERFYSWLQLTNSKDLRSLKIEDIQNYRSFLSSPFDSWCGKALPRKHHNWRPFIKKLSQTSINLHISIIKSLLSYLHTAGYMPYSFQKLIKVQYRYNEINSSDEYLSQNSYVRLRRNIIKFYGKDAIRYTFVLDLFFILVYVALKQRLVLLVMCLYEMVNSGSRS